MSPRRTSTPSSSFAEELLPVKDALEQTLAADDGRRSTRCKAGVELTLKQLDAAFDKAQIVEIDPPGEKFDPHRHQAMHDGRQPTSRRTPSCRCSRRATCSTTACCGRRWSPWPRRSDDAGATPASAGLIRPPKIPI